MIEKRLQVLTWLLKVDIKHCVCVMHNDMHARLVVVPKHNRMEVGILR
jgi:hypothetical protein